MHLQIVSQMSVSDFNMLMKAGEIGCKSPCLSLNFDFHAFMVIHEVTIISASGYESMLLSVEKLIHWARMEYKTTK